MGYLNAGTESTRSLAHLEIRVPAIVITGHDEPGNAARAYEPGAAAYLLKPLDEAVLIQAIERTCRGRSRPPA